VIQVFLAIHIIAIIIYQAPIVQPLMPPEDLPARLLSFNQIFTSSKTNELLLNAKLGWFSLVNPLMLVVTYLVVSTTSIFQLVRILT